MDSGVSMVLGGCQSRGHVVQRHRVLESMRRVDPLSQLVRWRTRIYRRQYSVPCPNSLWYVRSVVVRV